MLKVIDARRAEASCYLPEVAFNRSNTSSRWSNFIWFYTWDFMWQHYRLSYCWW